MRTKKDRICVHEYGDHLIDIPFDRLRTMLRPGDIVAAMGPYKCSDEAYIITDLHPTHPDYIRGVPDPYFVQDNMHLFRNFMKTTHEKGLNHKIEYTQIIGIRFTADVPRIPVSMTRYQKDQLEDLTAIDRYTPRTNPNLSEDDFMNCSLAMLSKFNDDPKMKETWYNVPAFHHVEIICTETHIDGICDCLLTYRELQLYLILNGLSYHKYLCSLPESTSLYRHTF